jgi:hypothetical protein
MTGAILSWAILAALSLAIAAWMAAIGNSLVALAFLVLAARGVSEALWNWDWR